MTMLTPREVWDELDAYTAVVPEPIRLQNARSLTLMLAEMYEVDDKDLPLLKARVEDWIRNGGRLPWQV